MTFSKMYTFLNIYSNFTLRKQYQLLKLFMFLEKSTILLYFYVIGTKFTGK